MKQITATNQMLYNFHVELQQIANNSVIGLLLRSKINDFYKENGLRINMLEQGILRIQKEHMEFENDKIKYEGEGENKKPVFLIGKSNETLQEAYKELMEKQIVINI